MTRIAVAGAGLIGRAHLAALAASPTCELSAIVDPAPHAQQLARAAGVPLHVDVPDLLVADRPDGVVLATPNGRHLPDALACMAAGVAVLVEKPLADCAASARALHEEAVRRDAVVLVGHHRTHSPIMRRARQLIDSGALGAVVAVNGTALVCKPDAYFDAGPWRAEPGGGPILLNLIHEIHNLCLLCGEIEQVQAYTSSATRGFAVEDTAAVVLRFTGGALGSFLLSDAVGSARSWEQTSGENSDYTTYPDEDCYHVAGTQGSLSIPTMRLQVFPSAQQRSWYAPLVQSVAAVQRRDPIELQMQQFGAVVRGKETPLCTARDGRDEHPRRGCGQGVRRHRSRRGRGAVVSHPGRACPADPRQSPASPPTSGKESAWTCFSSTARTSMRWAPETPRSTARRLSPTSSAA